MTSLRFAPFALVALAACAPKPNAASETSANRAKAAIVLDKGSYLVTLSRPEMCSPGELNIAKSLEVNANANDKILLKENGRVMDNLIRPAVCRSGSLSATILLDVAKKAELQADQLSIGKITQITGTSDVKAVNDELPAGKYLVRFERPENCSPSEWNLKKSINFVFNGALDTYSFEEGGRVTDNLIRPAVCRNGQSFGQAYLELPKNALIKGKGGFSLGSVRQVTRSKSIR